MLNRSLMEASAGLNLTASMGSAAFGLPRPNAMIQHRKRQEMNKGRSALKPRLLIPVDSPFFSGLFSISRPGNGGEALLRIKPLFDAQNAVVRAEWIGNRFCTTEVLDPGSVGNEFVFISPRE